MPKKSYEALSLQGLEKFFIYQKRYFSLCFWRKNTVSLPENLSEKEESLVCL